MTFREFFHTAFGLDSATGSQATSCEPHKKPHSGDLRSTDASKSCDQCPIDTTPVVCEPDAKRHCTSSSIPRDREKAESALDHSDGSAAAVCSDTPPAQEPDVVTEGSKRLYLAQHSLFDQVRDLRKDIMVRLHLENARQHVPTVSMSA